MTNFIKEVDLTNNQTLLYRGQDVKYVGRSVSGAFVIELPVTRNERNAPESHFENVWPFQVKLKQI